MWELQALEQPSGSLEGLLSFGSLSWPDLPAALSIDMQVKKKAWAAFQTYLVLLIRSQAEWSCLLSSGVPCFISHLMSLNHLVLFSVLSWYLRVLLPESMFQSSCFNPFSLKVLITWSSEAVSYLLEGFHVNSFTVTHFNPKEQNIT